MKKLLLILICLFVSFDVKSKEVILLCQIYQEFKGNRNLPVRNEYKPFESVVMYLDIKKQHFYKQSLNDDIFKQRTESFKEGDYTYSTDLSVSINDVFITSNFEVIENDKVMDSEYFYLNRYDGYFKLTRTFYDSSEMKLGNCKKVKKKLF